MPREMLINVAEREECRVAVVEGTPLEELYGGGAQALKDRPPIQSCLRRGQEIVVQVTKEGVKTKGPTLSTYMALAGKHLVMMPWMRGCGISHKIEDEDERKRLGQVLDEAQPPKGHGVIIRTAGEGASKRDIQNDLRYLNRLWSAILSRMDTEQAPGDIYQEYDLVIRALRDTFAGDIAKIICDSENTVRKINDFLSIA